MGAEPAAHRRADLRQATGLSAAPGSGGQHVAILLSTYNGAAFLPAQLASFRAQTYAAWSLHWRDDGSRDATCAILRDFTQAGPQPCAELVDGRGNLGAAGSFLALLGAVASGLGEAELVAFSDQDDVWLPEKLARAVAALANADPLQPALYCARQRLVDGDLRDIGPSPVQVPPAGFAAALIQNLAAGCTIVMNRTAALRITASRPPPGTLHDWWSYIVVMAAGGRFVQDAEPVILYRQHGGNLVGAPSNLLRRAVAAARRGPAQFMDLLRAHVAALREQPELLTPAAGRDVARLSAALQGGAWARLRALGLPGLRRQTWPETWTFRLWFLLG